VSEQTGHDWAVSVLSERGIEVLENTRIVIDGVIKMFGERQAERMAAAHLRQVGLPEMSLADFQAALDAAINRKTLMIDPEEDDTSRMRRG
jgi:hypothetical protein